MKKIMFMLLLGYLSLTPISARYVAYEHGYGFANGYTPYLKLAESYNYRIGGVKVGIGNEHQYRGSKLYSVGEYQLSLNMMALDSMYEPLKHHRIDRLVHFLGYGFVFVDPDIFEASYSFGGLLEHSLRTRVYDWNSDEYQKNDFTYVRPGMGVSISLGIQPDVLGLGLGMGLRYSFSVFPPSQYTLDDQKIYLDTGRQEVGLYINYRHR